jgi:hypothetical protein
MELREDSRSRPAVSPAPPAGVSIVLIGFDRGGRNFVDFKCIELLAQGIPLQV